MNSKSSGWNIKIGCPVGRLHSITAFGLSVKNRQKCQMVQPKSDQPVFEFSEKCSSLKTPSLLTTAFAKDLISKFDQNCRDKQNCQISLKNDLLDDKCKAEIDLRESFSEFN